MIFRYALLLAMITVLSPVINYRIFKNVKIFPMLENGQQTVSFTYVGISGEKVDITIYLLTGAQQKILYSRSITYGNAEFNDYFTIIPFLTENKQEVSMMARTATGAAGSALIPLQVYETRNIDPSMMPLLYSPYIYGIVDDYGKVHQYSERIEFINFHRITESPSAHKLDLSALRIAYESDAPISNLDEQPVKIYIADENEYFARLKFNHIKKARELNAQLIWDGKYYRIALEDRLFVDRYSHMMSLESDTDFILTDELYFPVNFFREMNYITFSIEIPAMGAFGYNVIFHSQYYSHKTYIGSCDKAAYCLSVDESDIKEVNTNKIEVKL